MASTSFKLHPSCGVAGSKHGIISLAGRILANFPENLTAGQKIADELTSWVG